MTSTSRTGEIDTHASTWILKSVAQIEPQDKAYSLQTVVVIIKLQKIYEANFEKKTDCVILVYDMCSHDIRWVRHSLRSTLKRDRQLHELAEHDMTTNLRSFVAELELRSRCEAYHRERSTFSNTRYASNDG